MLTAQMEEMQKEIEELQAEEKDLMGAMGELKKKLYAKFGSSINLEEE